MGLRPSLTDHTTLGREYDLPLRWRLLVTFAWSTSVLFALAQQFQARELRRGDSLVTSA